MTDVKESNSVVVKSPIELNNWEFKPKNLEEALRLASCYVNSGLLPKRFDTPEKLVVAMQYCKELGLPMLVGMRQLAIINDTPSIFGDLPLALAHKSGKLKSLIEWLFDSTGKKICSENNNLSAKVFGAHCEGVRDNGITASFDFTLTDAEQAGLLKGFGWLKYPKDMLLYRCRGRMLKSLVPDALAGVCIGEYDYGVHEAEIKDGLIYKNKNVVEGASDEIRNLEQEVE